MITMTYSHKIHWNIILQNLYESLTRPKDSNNNHHSNLDSTFHMVFFAQFSQQNKNCFPFMQMILLSLIMQKIYF